MARSATVAAATCGKCGTPYGPDASFCGSCGAPRAEAAVAKPAAAADSAWQELKPKLEQAAAAAHAALDEASSGQIDEDELRKKLFKAGHVVHDHVAWMLDVEQGRWSCYDGLELRPNPLDAS